MSESLPKASLVLLLKDDQVLLARKKRGFGEGKITGIGGRREAGEAMLETAVREMQEETGVTPFNPKEVARLEFLFPHQPTWSMEVHVFTATDWLGDPSESDEVAPQWFPKKSLPFEQMWDDGRYWLPDVLAGRTLTASFVFDDGDRVLRCSLLEPLEF